MIDYIAAIKDNTNIHHKEAILLGHKLAFQQRYIWIQDGVLRWLFNMEVPTENVLIFAREIGLRIDVEASNAARNLPKPIPSLGDLRVGFGTDSLLSKMIQNKEYENGEGS